MKILITNLKDKPQKSGVGYYVNDLYKLLKKHNIDVKILIPLEYSKNYDFKYEDIILIKNIQNKILKWIYYTLILPIKSKNFDIVHYSSEDIPIVFHKMFNYFFNKTQTLIMTIHDLGEFKTNRYSKLKDFLRKRILIPLEYKSADKVTTVSNTTKEDIIKFLGKKKEIFVCYSVFNSPKRMYNCNCKKIKEKFYIKNDYFLYVSQINHPSKNHLNLIKAFEKLYNEKDFKYDLVLVGTPAYNAEIVLDYLNKTQYKNRIHYLGYLSNEDLYSIYECCSFYIFPSLFEGFGRGILESWFFEKPLLCSDRGSLKEIAKDGALYIDPTSISNMCKKILEIIRDKNLQNELVEKGKQNLLLYSEENIFKQISQLYGVNK